MDIQFHRSGDLPIRAELFSAERLEQHAKSLAAAQPIGASSHARKSLRRRLNENSHRLIADFRILAKAAKNGRQITSAGEWFLDNFHIVEEQIRKVKRDLPADFYNELPKLAEGPLRGYPRVYGIAWALIAHTDGAFDVDRLERFICAYQEIDPLKIGELWAIAITLRITLVENLRRLIQIVVARLGDADRAETIAKRVLADRSDIRPALDSIVIGNKASATFIAQLEQRLRNQNEVADHILQQIETVLRAQGTHRDAVIQEEYQLQGADDISVRNVINAMRLVSNIDWADFVENVSLVDVALNEHPGFAAMDFPTRDRYRRAIESLARRAPLDEIAVASAVVREAAVSANSSPSERDPGYYLIGRGTRQFERKIGYRPSLSQRFWRAVASTGLTGYVGAIGLVTGCITALVLAPLVALRVGTDAVVALGILAILPAYDIAIAMVNRIVTNRWAPRSLPALALRDGVPDSLKTLLVVPVLLNGIEAIDEQIARMEVHYLSNLDARLQFVLLSDWIDSDAQSVPDDDHLLARAKAGIQELNARYAKNGPPLFLILHRARTWNAAQGKWMGWERKRGKLHELNRLLRGATDTGFMGAESISQQIPAKVRYIITLDADTRLPRGAAKRLIGKMAHPLNLPFFDPKLRRVTRGHGILQPRVTPSLPIGTESSLFQWAFSGPNGLDPYAFVVSDVYQDLFEEGSFIGKGIYDIDVFEQSLHQRIPENTVLSHDLLEGVFSRAALVSDVELVEEFPSRYDVELARQHRWVRGDWQLLPWVIGLVSHKDLDARGAVLPPLGRWKMLDNLRRSLSAPALLLAFLIGWQLPPAASLIWTGFLALTIMLPPLLPILGAAIPRHAGFSWRGHVRNLTHDAVLAATQILFNVAFLARVAYLSLDAILRTIFRLIISRKYLLEWVTFAQTNYSRHSSWKGLALQLAGSLAFAIAVSSAIAHAASANLLTASPFVGLWMLSPLIARWASQAPRAEAHLDMSQDDRLALRSAARLTWLFFEKFVTTDDNYLPPDNFQEVPKGQVAHRTSPTNIGLYLNAVLAARDFGWIGLLQTVERLEQTLDTLQKLERFRGHFLNWYDTKSLGSLNPRYVSTVDSGNLAGSLLVVKHSCAHIVGAPDPNRVVAGLTDTLAVVKSALKSTHQQNNEVTRMVAQLSDTLKDCAIEQVGLTQLESLHDQALTLSRLADGVGSASQNPKTP